MVVALALLALLGGPAPFTLVNGTDVPLSGLTVRQIGGSAPTQTLVAGRLSAGARMAVPAPIGDGCAYALEGEDGGIRLRWNDVNLCDVKSVTLRRRGDTLWVDYD